MALRILCATVAVGALTLTATASGGIPNTGNPAAIGVDPSSSSRVEYPFGVSSYGDGGWAWDTTSTGWTRQAPEPTRVAFAPDVAVARGWPTVRAQIDPGDPALWGGQRAQVYTTDEALRQHGLPSLLTQRGDYAWYAFAFRTSTSYRPQRALPYPNWNTIFSWHDTGFDFGGAHCWAPQANVEMEIATGAPRGGGWRFFTRPRLGVEVYGGDPRDADWWHHGHRWYGPRFVPGRRYVVQMGVRWGDSGDGSMEVWINGKRLAARAHISTLWSGSNVYPIFGNYRQPASAGSISAPSAVYYGGFVRGGGRVQVGLPRP
jgi:hypothetical protein